MGGYNHFNWSRRLCDGYKWNNFMNGIDLTDRKYNEAFPNRRLSTWEIAELREYCEGKGVPMPEGDDRTLARFLAIVGRAPTYWEEGKGWVTPAPAEGGTGAPANP